MNRPARFVIIGADAAGMSAASEARRLDPTLEILAFERGSFISYSQCGLPYLVGGHVEDRQRLVARTVEQFAERDITVKTRHTVLRIDPARQVILVNDLDLKREFEQPYDKLLIATGAAPLRSTLPGSDLQGVFHLDIMEDALAIMAYLDRHQPRQAVIVGGGYIGLEMAENLAGLGLKVRLLQRGEQLFTSVDLEIAGLLNGELERHGVDISLCESILEACIGSNGRVDCVRTSQGQVQTDLVLLATGVRPEVSLALEAGIKCGLTGAISVDAHLRTSQPAIFAAGDCAEHWHRLLQKPAWLPLGTTANKQGRLAGRNIAGQPAAYAGIVGTAVTRVFDLQIARTGLTTREANLAGLESVSIVLNSTDLAGYMPEATPLHLKLVAEKSSGRLLGGQVVAQNGADKRIDVLATALYQELTLEQLTELDLAYAPPFNSVWDPLQVAATSLLRRARG